MTAQMPDRFRLDKQDYDLVGVSAADGPFDPAKHGMTVQALHTACWRGFICTYGIDRDRLVLRHLQGRFATGSAAPKLDGDNPEVDENDVFEYKKIKLKLPYSGGLLIATDFVAGLYQHMGFHPAWKYQKVIELIFDTGKLTERRDLSADMALARDAIASGAKNDPDFEPKELASLFTLDYSRSII